MSGFGWGREWFSSDSRRRLRILMAFPFGLETWFVEHFWIEDPFGALALRQIEHDAASGPADVAKEFARPGDAVRGQDDILQFAEAMRSGDWFLGEAIQRSAGDATALQRIIQRIFIRDSASRGVDQVGAGLHQRQLVCADQASSAVVQRAMQ